MSKYHAKKTTVNGITFDSKKEAARFGELLALQNAGVISELRLQEEFVLQNAFTSPCGDHTRAITYKADFTYIRDGKRIIEDVKGIRTDVYKIKKRLMAGKGYEIQEV